MEGCLDVVVSRAVLYKGGMVSKGWLKAGNVLPAVAAESLEQLIAIVAQNMAEVGGIDPERVSQAFRRATAGENFSLGSGVAIPHTEDPGLEETLVCLVTTAAPLPLRTLDGRAPDIFLFILSKPDPHAHLVLLAHWARLAQSRTFLEGLRRSATPDEVLALVDAAELRHRAHAGAASPRASHDLVLISVSGEKLVDALLIGLVDDGFDDACVLEAQSLREAAAREVPLFAGFRDIFGDPGGRRILLLEAPEERTEGLVSAVRRICEEHEARDARISVLPLQLHWASPVAPVSGGGEGHG
jgi:mannitol/fructose-specific phosphotransferase system IIA component (Ntr-type)